MMDNENHSFSVVTPSFNMARFLPETIESVLANLEPGDQYYIIDGGSTDHSVEMIRRYESLLTGWISEADNGYADALVKGFQRCTGEYLCWINSGDLLFKGALKTARHALEEGAAELIYGDDVYIDEQNKVIKTSKGEVNSLKNMMLFGGWTPLQDACFWRRSLYEQLGGINPSLKYAADYDFFLRASLTGKCVYVPKVFSAYRRHPGQKGATEAEQYEAERQACRKRMLTQLDVPVPKRLVLEPVYWFAVRWRHHVARRFHRQEIPAGTTTAGLIVG